MESDGYGALYSIPKDHYTLTQINSELRTEGKVTAYDHPVKYSYLETAHTWEVPICWAVKQGYPARPRYPAQHYEWPDVDLEYRNNQADVEKTLVQELKDIKSVRLKAPTAYGKSFIALFVARALQTNVLIVVPSDEILKGFEETCKIFGIKCGKIYRGTENPNKLVTLTTYGTLANKVKAGKDYLNNFGLTVFDEAHKVGCDTFLNAFMGVSSEYRLSVSAKFVRKDELHGMFENCLGPIVAEGVIDKQMPKALWTPQVKSFINMDLCTSDGNFNATQYDEFLAEHSGYNDFIEKIAREIISCGNRRLLIKLRRVRQVEELFNRFGPKISGKFIGESSKKELTSAAQKDIILYTKKDEGLDMGKYLGDELEASLVPLNTCLIPIPYPDPLQICGRVGRIWRGVQPLIIYLHSTDFYSRAKFRNASEVFKDLQYQQISDLTQFLEKGDYHDK
jgi:hypothetical protein